jgi:CubicO group peptidase (beta-lactamase class C family)
MKKSRKGIGWKWGIFYTVVSLGIVAGIMVFVTHAAVLKGPDYWPTDDWHTSTPEKQGMKSEVLAGLFDQLEGQHMHSIVVTRNGYLVAEAYNQDLNKDAKQHIFSATKSVTSALTGIAMDEGKVKGLTQTLYDIFPDWIAFNTNEMRRQITIGELLTMTSSIHWNNDNEYSTNRMMATQVWPQYVISQPLDDVPGKVYTYSNGDAVLAGSALEKLVGEPLSNYANRKLFQPLGIKDVDWATDPSGVTNGAWGIHMTTREMAKFGYLYLHDGVWDGKQIVPKDWVSQSIAPYMVQESKEGDKRGYGFFWWMRALNQKDDIHIDNEIYSAIGSGGQRIAVIPKYNLVIAITGNNMEDAFFSDNFIVNNVVASIVSDKAIKENPDGQKQLNTKIAQFAQTSDPSGNTSTPSTVKP